MSQILRALILGAGYAGEGHTLALQRAGVEVIAMASRTANSCQATASRLGIPHASTDWRTLLAELQPDIVAVATPGGTHLEMAGAALAAGCHVYCDKPLALTAPEARQLYALAQAHRVKTAYAASYRYQPQTLYARALIQAGVLGAVTEVECVSHYNWPRLMPFGWPHRLEMGGGRLNNNFTHKLAIVQNMVGGEILAAMGETRNDLKRVPIGNQVHDFRDYFKQVLTPAEAARSEWAEVDSDWSYTVLVRLGDRAASLDQSVSATFRHSALNFGKNTDYVAIYGEKGTLHIEGAYTQGAIYLRTGDSWEEVTVPEAIHAALPPEPDHSQRNWDQLARDFVANIRGEGDTGYPTFRDGWMHQQVIDIVRSGQGWATVAGTLPA
ncbi:MAG: Gfo/Idh/MocA family oxidoreductase [Caldilineaceae bacterium]|nr:Gfo/Idh/MocA family oxidoreductase [Caldilineaceae bacterium]